MKTGTGYRVSDVGAALGAQGTACRAPTKPAPTLPSAVAARFIAPALPERLAVLLTAVALDLLLGEPPARWHPVVWLGALIDRGERGAPAPERRASLAYGAAATLGTVAAVAALAALLERPAGRLPRAARIVLLAVLLKPSFAVRALLEAGGAVHEALARDDLPAGRHALAALVSRDTASLTAEEVAGAAIESLAENTTDSFVGPWLAWLIFGLPGAWAFRVVNTLDSRWGYHGRYELLGRVPARLDDVCAALPARLSAIALIAAAPLCGAGPAEAMRALRRDRRRTGSPNSGWTMAAMAGALGRRLSKRDAYVLNAEGAPACAGDIVRAQRMVVLSAALALATALLAQPVRRQRRMVTTCRQRL